MNDSQQNNHQRNNGKRRRGVSLIEVLVVLVILVTGILTIIRLFPSGFFSIQSAGNAALAEGLGGAAINRGAQDAQSLPEAILPGRDLLTLMNAPTAATYSNYDPDDPNTLNNARIVSNETITVPTAVRGQSVYVVHYGPVVMPANPKGSVAGFPSYFTVNSPYWTAQSGDSATEAIVGSTAPVTVPQHQLFPGQERFLVDLANQKIAIPYAAYTLTDNTTTPPTYKSYDQRIVVVITDMNNKSYIQSLDVRAGITQDSANKYAPKDGVTADSYLPDTSDNYHGGWFSPTGVDTAGNPTSVNYADPSIIPSQNRLPVGDMWKSVTLYRPYQGMNTPMTPGTAPAFSLDPYEFALLTGNIGDVTGPNAANPGVVAFNPKAANGSGASARKAQISYIVSSWSILHEDYDIPALSGGATAVVRTTVPNLLLAGSANPDNSINPGIAGSSSSIVILDLDTGNLVAPFSNPFDPTTPDKPINNEDVNGTSTDQTQINVSYSTGRIVFGSQVFTDGRPHRVRVFYAADLGWTVAVQKTPAYFQPASVSGPVSDMTPLAADQYVYDGASTVYFARCNAGKTVEIDGTYTASGGGTQTFVQTLAVDPIIYDLGAPDVRILLAPPAGATNVTVTAVRGLSARSVVAWKERNQYKVHSVDALLTRTP